MRKGELKAIRCPKRNKIAQSAKAHPFNWFSLKPCKVDKKKPMKNHFLRLCFDLHFNRVIFHPLNSLDSLRSFQFLIVSQPINIFFIEFEKKTTI